MKQAKIISSFLFLFLIFAPDSYAREPRLINGVVKDYLTRKPLAGMAVQLGTSIAVTDKKGRFSISCLDTVIDDHTLLSVSYTAASGTAPENTIIPDKPIGSVVKDEMVIFRYPHSSICNPVTANAYYMVVSQPYEDGYPRVYRKAIIKPIVNYIPPLPVSDCYIPRTIVSSWAKFKYLFHKHSRHNEK